ncbi:response regulator [Azospirillum sp. ST 5-10]|uniref:response regulator n=1 Tax=unclassified Azospirillum TaxID=2630922 RepID=UPI003F49C7AE
MAPTDAPRVLVAEDEVLAAMALEEALSRAGFGVVLAGDGEQAAAAFAESAVDVLVTDLRMPRLDGVGLIRRLRSARPDLPVVVMTGYPPEGDFNALCGGGASDIRVLLKPVSPNDIISAIRAALPA